MTPAEPELTGEIAPAPSTLGNGCWTRSRVEILSWLRRNAPSLSELYEGAVGLLDETPLPGRVRFIAHAVREIRNRLPDAIAGPTKRQRLDYTSRVDDISRLPAAQTLLADVGGATAPNTTIISIDSKLAKKFAKLLQDHLATREKPLDSARRLFQGLAPENTQLRDTLTPVLQQWLVTTKWFGDRAHDAGHADSYYPEKELRHHFNIFESTLSALIRPFFDALEDLDAILEDANS
jgi:hypothetical protein